MEAGADFEGFYASLGVSVVMTVLNGDCAFDVMLMMLGETLTDGARKALRIEISDYLMSRVGEPWMHDIMSVCDELSALDVEKSRKYMTEAVPSRTSSRSRGKRRAASSDAQ